MNTETIIKVIQKCIDDTKQNKLYWKLLSSNPSLEKNKSLSLNDVTSARSIIVPTHFSNAYYTEYKEGFFFLKRAYEHTSLSLLQEGTIFLYVQKSLESYAELITASDSNISEINILLRRLFILVDAQISAPDNFIDDFLNS
jgi:hypothetical protein|uniref:Uncharacterized protein n=1 Tax=Siphoviridae sp. ctv2R2 TaxID=2823609 RepID=A0A8S5LAK3_9CAUD|nr:MAG TPA: hypothetical protein [Siphoviridae sp. ctv2R2]